MSEEAPESGGTGKMTVTKDWMVAKSVPYGRDKLASAPSPARPKRAATTKKVSGPTLEAIPPKEPGENLCGGFVWTRTLRLSNASKPGVIVQEVTRTFENVEKWTPGGWVGMNDAEINAYVISAEAHPYATVGRYWELWRLHGDFSIISPNDRFSLTSIVPPGVATKDAALNTTRGTYIIEGEMSYWAAPDGMRKIDPAALGFVTDTDHPAGGLPHRDSDPGLDGQGFTQVGNTVECKFKVEWDSSSTGKKLYGEYEIT